MEYLGRELLSQEQEAFPLFILIEIHLAFYLPLPVPDTSRATTYFYFLGLTGSEGPVTGRHEGIHQGKRLALLIGFIHPLLLVSSS